MLTRRIIKKNLILLLLASFILSVFHISYEHYHFSADKISEFTIDCKKCNLNNHNFAIADAILLLTTSFANYFSIKTYQHLTDRRPVIFFSRGPPLKT